jgi:N-terminal domain of reverse transcriptase
MTLNENLNNSARSIYYPSKTNKWTGVDWSKVEKTISNLQHRITKAAECGNDRKVRNLQRLLNNSISARLKSVRIVARTQGKRLELMDKSGQRT